MRWNSCGAVIGVWASIVACVAGSIRVSHAGQVTVESADTAIALAPAPQGIRIVSLKSPGGSAEWAAADPSAASVRFVDHVQIEGKDVPVHWHPEATSNANVTARPGTFRFDSDDPPLALVAEWRRPSGAGPIELWLRITNQGRQTILVPRQTSLALTTTATPDGHGVDAWWVEKGGGTPTAVGEHRTRVAPGFSAKLKSGPLAVSEPRDPIPLFAMIDAAAGGGWYAGLEFSGRVMMRLNARAAERATLVDADLGLEPKEDVMSRVAPGQTYEPPVAFVGCFRGDADDLANRLHRWVSDDLRPPVRDERYPLLVNNSWGSGMAVDDALARSMIEQSAALGLEMFHIDAGWFRAVGDWRPNPAKFPAGLGPISDFAHQKGLKFGLWVGWTQVGNSPGFHDDPLRVVSVDDPARRDWISQSLTDGWKPGDFWGETLCLADADAQHWCLELLRDLVKREHIDMLEHDQRMIIDNCPRTGHAHTTSRVDMAFRACEGYYAVYDALRADHPDLLFEDCVNGGQMVDFGVLRRVHYVSITDTYDPISNRRAFYDASYLLPPAMCECYVEQHVGRTPANFVYMLRSGMMGWFTLMLDTRRWTPQQHELAKRQFAIYKSRLRPLIRDADEYHVSERPDGRRWDGIEYWDPHQGRGVLFAFRGTTGEPEHRFPLKGLEADANYELTFEDASSPTTSLSGRELTSSGLPVRLGEPESSELVYLRRK